MRSVWIAVACLAGMLAAGCATPGTSNGPDCDNTEWVEGKNTIVVQDSWARTGVRSSPDKEDTLGNGSLRFLDYPLDRIEMDFHWKEHEGRESFRGIVAEQGTLTLTLWDADGQPLKAHRNGGGAARHEWSWTDTYDGNFTLTIALEDRLDPPDPRPVVAKWHFDGLPSDPQEPGDVAVAWYEASYWYRRCTPS